MDVSLIAVLVAAFLVLATAGVFLWSRGGISRGDATAVLIPELRRRLRDTEGRLTDSQRQEAQAQAQLAAAEARSDEIRRAAAEQKLLWDEAGGRLEDAFKALAADALRDSQGELVKSAERLLQDLRERSVIERDASRESVEQVVNPLREALDQYKRETNALEQRRLTDLGTVGEQYRELSSAAATLRVETSKLATALRSPHVRGRWGQLTLRRTAELAGMAPHCDFYEEETVPGIGKRLRPDMVVRLPTERLIVVDSKVPLDGYLDALSATDDAQREQALDRHARQTREHISQLAAKGYQDEFDGTPDFVVAFIPNDSILAAAVDKDPSLVEFALSRGVVVATPSSFFALLKTVEYGWRQEQLAENAKQVSALGQQLAERLAVMVEHFDRVGGSLRKAVEAYNATVSSLESRVLPSARRFKSLGVSGRAGAVLSQVEVAPRTIAPMPSAATSQLFPGEDDSIDDTDSLESPFVTCVACGAGFVPSDAASLYCSADCRTRGVSAATASDADA